MNLKKKKNNAYFNQIFTEVADNVQVSISRAFTAHELSLKKEQILNSEMTVKTFQKGTKCGKVYRVK